MDLQALKNELTADSLGRGYSGMDDEAAANSLNVDGRDVNRESVSGGEIAASLVRVELAALTPAEQNYVRALLACESIPLAANFKAELGAVFPQGSATRANITALLKRQGSRAEELGLGRITPSDVAKARQLP